MKLRIKMPLIYAVLIASLGVVFILFPSRMVEDRMVEEEQEYFKSLTNALALNSANAIVLKDYAALSGIVDNMRKGEHVSYAVILDENGSVLAHSQHELEGKAFTDPVSIKAAASLDLLMQAAGSDTMDVTAPLMIAGKKWGAVRIGFSLAEMKMKVAKARNIILFAGLTATLLGIVASVLIAKKITGPIHKLHKGTEIISEGNLDYRLDIPTGDEVEQLAKAFNTMTGHIQKNYLALSESEEKYRKLIESANDAVFVADAETGLIIETNKRAEELLGRPINEIIGMRQTELHPKEDAEFYASVFKEHIQKGDAVQTDLFVAHKDGGKIPVEISASVSEIKGRKIITGIFRDITERKKTEEKMILQERLAAVGHLAAGIAHDFNNLLTGIIGYTDLLLLDTELSPDARQMAETISQGGRSAAQLIRQILDFSRKSASEMKLFDLKPFIKEFLKLIKKLIPENIRVSYSIGKGEYMVNADPTKMQQVFMNLAVNARDAMPEGGELKFGLSHIQITDNPPFPGMPIGDWIAVTVSDTGIGIPPEVLPHIFEPFFTTKETGRGTGLGLAQVYGIVKQHNGYIDAKTERGKGTSFIIYLPPSMTVTEESLIEKEIVIPKGQGETILIAEDDEVVRNFIKRVLSGLVYKALTAKNGKEALNIFECQCDEIGLVITDMIMPEMGGMELSREIKQRKPSVKILGITGYDFCAKKEDLLEAGIEAIIQKPFNMEKLAQAVSDALE